MTAYYNEFDPKAVAWLKALAAAGHITDGVFDDRSIADVKAEDVVGFDECHFFAGIAGWRLALQLAGWPQGRSVWTGSCPCQPFSGAGKGLGTADARHLWPDFCRLIALCKPATVFGEQVASKAGREWLAGVRADMEALGYAFGCADLCAASVGAPHIRQRVFWVADASSTEWGRRAKFEREHGGTLHAANRCGTDGLADTGCAVVRSERQSLAGAPGGSQGEGNQRKWVRDDSRNGGDTDGGLGNSNNQGLEGRGLLERECSSERTARETGHGHWTNCELVPCRDGKTRRIESGLAPLAHGVSGRVAQLRGLGNAIVPQVAAEFIKAFLETE